MPFPTSQIGNVGNLPGQPTNTADYYSVVPGPSATTPGSAGDYPALGNFSILADGTFVQFLTFAATTANYNACQISGAWASTFKVTPTTAANQLVVAVNDRCGQSAAAASATWCTLRGLAFPLVAASVAAGRIVAASATAGTLYGATAGTDLQSNMTNTVVVGGVAASSPVYIA